MASPNNIGRGLTNPIIFHDIDPYTEYNRADCAAIQYFHSLEYAVSQIREGVSNVEDLEDLG